MIDKGQFADEFADLAFVAGIVDVCALEFPEYMRQRNEESPRSFAEVDPHELYFAFAPQVLALDWSHRRGLIMHELGHVLCRDLPNGGTEDDADKAAERAFGERIIYDKAWPGKGLQCVQCGPRENPALPDPDVARRFIGAVSLGNSPARLEKIESALEDILIGYQQGEIPNIVYQDAKSTLGWAIELAWDSFSRYWAGRGDSPESALSWYISARNLHDTISAKKKLDLLKKKPNDYIDRGSYRLSDVDPDLVADMTRILDVAYPLALMVKDMKGMIVKGRSKSAGPTKAQLSEMERAKDPRLKTCAVCFNEIITSQGSPVRHGFSVVTQGRGHGLLGAWHTGPCMGTEYPHYGLSSAGTKAALEMTSQRLRVVQELLRELALRPSLYWETREKKQIEVVPGDKSDPYRSGRPSYESLHSSRVSALESERKALVSSIDFYKDKIAEWEYQP